jgi:hypothetical protein
MTTTTTSTNLRIALNITHLIDYDSSDIDNGLYIVDYIGDGLPTIRKTLNIPIGASQDDKKIMIFQNTPYPEWYVSNPEVFPPARTIEFTG